MERIRAMIDIQPARLTWSIYGGSICLTEAIVIPAVALALGLVLTGSSCRRAASDASNAADSTVTVSGQVTMRGNEPFAALTLAASNDSLYVLVTKQTPGRDSLLTAVPGRLRVTGTLYRDWWQGRRRPHLRVTAWERSSP